MPTPTFQSPHGVVLKFNGVRYTVTNIVSSSADSPIDCTDLSIPTGTAAFSRFRPAPLSAWDLKVDFIGGKAPPTDKAYTLITEGTASGHTPEWSPVSVGRSALATGLSLTASAGDLVKGSVTFKIVG